MAATVFEIFSLGGKRFLSELSALSQLVPPKFKFLSPDFKISRCDRDDLPGRLFGEFGGRR